jgi:putative ATP-dependent endonuclease of the OLD family
LHGATLVDDHIKSATKNSKTLDAVQAELMLDSLSEETRIILGKASRTKRGGWFKSVSWMEEAARMIVGPDLVTAEAGFQTIIESVFVWANDG